MNCGQVRKYLPLYIDSDLPDEKACEIEKHLAGCEKCRVEMDKYIRIKEALGGLEETPLPDGYEERLEKKMDTEKEARPLLKWITAIVVAASMFLGAHIADSGSVRDKRIVKFMPSVTSKARSNDNTITERSEAKKHTPQYSEKDKGGTRSSIIKKHSKRPTLFDKMFTTNLPDARDDSKASEGNDIEEQKEDDKKDSVKDDNNTTNGTDSKKESETDNVKDNAKDNAKYAVTPHFSLYGFKSEEGNNDSTMEKTLKKYGAVILNTSEKDGNEVITVKVDKDKEDELLSELGIDADKVDRDSEDNLKIIIGSDKDE